MSEYGGQFFSREPYEVTWKLLVFIWLHMKNWLQEENYCAIKFFQNLIFSKYALQKHERMTKKRITKNEFLFCRYQMSSFLLTRPWTKNRTEQRGRYRYGQRALFSVWPALLPRNQSDDAISLPPPTSAIPLPRFADFPRWFFVAIYLEYYFFYKFCPGLLIICVNVRCIKKTVF